MWKKIYCVKNEKKRIYRNFTICYYPWLIHVQIINYTNMYDNKLNYKKLYECKLWFHSQINRFMLLQGKSFCCWLRLYRTFWIFILMFDSCDRKWLYVRCHLHVFKWAFAKHFLKFNDESYYHFIFPYLTLHLFLVIPRCWMSFRRNSF